MRRGTLIYRNHHRLTLPRAILARQPLLARLSRHRQFLQAPGLPNLPALPASQAIPASPVYTDPLPVVGRNFRTPIILETTNTGDNEYLQNYAATDPAETRLIVRTADGVESSQKHEITDPVGADLSAPAATGATWADKSAARALNRRLQGNLPADEALAETEIIREIEREAAPEIIHEPEPESLAERQEDVLLPISSDATEQIAPLPDNAHASRDETSAPLPQDAEARQQVEGNPAGEIVPPESVATPPVETVKPRRPRRHSEELRVQPRSRPAPSTPPTKREISGPQRAAQVAQARQRPDPETAGDDPIRADELFPPTTTDRSPQAWLARLMGKSLPAQEDASANAHTDSKPERKPLPAIADSETPVDKGLTVTPPERSGPAAVVLSGSEESEATGLAGDGGRDASLPLSITHSPLSRTRPENGSPFAEQTQGQSRMTGQPTQEQQEETHWREEQSQQQVASAGNSRAAMPEVSGISTTGIPTGPEMAKITPTVQTRRAEPLSSRTRRFLRPLVGIDPASVQIHRDAQAARLADAYHADAVTLGNDVELAAEHTATMETPETLGLLAHELTHVARLRQPGFVPPIAQTQPASPTQTRKPASAQNAAMMDEETLALHVERRVRSTAEGTAYIVGPPLAGGLGPTAGPEAGGSATPLAGGLEHMAALGLENSAAPLPSPAESRRPDNDPWGGLPAPWEPLPGWLTAPAQPVAMEQSAASFPAPAPVPVAPPAQSVVSNGSHHQANGQAEPEVQRAARGRSVEETLLSVSTPVTSEQEARAPEPDLDELAQQVYSILRNRLEVERRRHR